MRPFPFLALAVLALAMVSAAQTADKGLKAGLAAISPAEAYDIVRTLAGPEFRGRLTGDKGYAAAAEWAAKKLSAWGLKPGGAKGSYLQPYPSPFTIVDKAEMTILLPAGPADPSKPAAYKEMRLVPEKDFLPLLYSDSGDRTAEAVFAGWGISAPDLGYDDYAGLEVKGKFVLCFRGTPDRDPRYEPYDEHRTRMKTALDKGALGIVYIYPEVNSHPNGDWLADFMPAMVSEKAADAIFKEVNGSAAELRKTLTTYKRPVSFPLQAKARVAFASRHFPDAVGYNVVGWVEGSDPKLRREVVVLGGHFDHTGTHMGLLFPGADDNASGSAAVMEVAEAYASLGRKPKRSVAFVLFGGEELGLQGSTWFAEHVPSVFGKVDAMLNFDMVGEGDKSGFGYSDSSPELKELVESADKQVGTVGGAYPIKGVGVRGSDHAPFYQKGIPVVSFHSNGPHLFYHLTGDTIYRINPDMLADVARLAFLAAEARADR